MGKFDGVLIATDFDNTLVHTQAALDAGVDVPPICERNRRALEYFIAEGGYFTVSTGRALAAFARFVPGLPLNAPCVVSNGAALYDFAAERHIYTAYLGESIYEHMDEIFAAFPGIALEVYHDDRRIHAMHINDYIRSHLHFTRPAAMEVASFREIDLPMIRVLFEEDEKTLLAVEAFIRSRSWGDEYELIFSSANMLELTARGATKGDMVLRLAELLGVERKDIYCVGDHKNDLPMLEISAIPFAPENCVDELREAGCRIVCHCADGALADVVEILDGIYG